MTRSRFVRTLAGFLLLAPAARVFAAELSAGDGSTRPAPLPLTRRGGTLDMLRRNRETQILRVDAYRRRGIFPQNVDFAGERVPYFVDARGVACAVANLMREDGYHSAVTAIAAGNNHVRVMDVTEGPLLTWVRTSGLTQPEAARIQPSYDFMRPPPTPTPLDMNVVDRRRIREHLGVVVAELRRDTEASLAIALEIALNARDGSG